MRGVNLTEREKLLRYEGAKQHIGFALEQRHLYNQQLQECKTSIAAFGKVLGPSEPLGFEGKMHYAFDFAQQMHFPSDPMQAGPIYFLTPRKCLLFGMCCTGLPHQVSNKITLISNTSERILILTTVLKLEFGDFVQN